MKNFINKFKIPTLLGLSIIIVGIATGVFLTLKEQTFISKASPDLTAQNITLSNISDDSVTISWQTPADAASFITFGQADPNKETVLDDRDAKIPNPYVIHYVTIKNLLPKTTYQYKIITGKISSDIFKFGTTTPLINQTGFRPIIGTVLDKDTSLADAVVYLSIADATVQSALTKKSGNFLIPISQIRKSDLSDAYPLTEDTTAKLTILSEKGAASALFKIKASDKELPPISLGEDLDLTSFIKAPEYDLNWDGKINAADNAIVLQNFGPPPAGGPKNEQGSSVYKKADLNGDGIVDQKDLDLMAKQINQ